MRVILARNVNHAFVDGLWWLRIAGVKEESRNGPVIVSPEPVTTVYKFPRERILFDVKRDANPFFHLAESLWMLAGKEDVDTPAYFAKQMSSYSDDGETLHGAYGYRWRVKFGTDQLFDIYDQLKTDPLTRRAVLSIYDPYYDSSYAGKDLPCNTHSYFRINDGRLDMTVCNRSNDLVWGCYGANAVHFSMLQEFMANMLDIPVGRYYQMSNNFHIYPHHYHFLQSPPVLEIDPYNHVAPPDNLFDNGRAKDFLEDCEQFCVEGIAYNPFNTPFFNTIVLPMMRAYEAHKDGDIEKELEHAESIRPCDWSRSVGEWLARRRKLPTSGG